MNERGRINGEACLHAHLVIRLPIRQLTVTMPSRASLLSKERIIFILNGWKVGKFAMTGIKRHLQGRSDESVFPKGAGKRRRFLYLIIRAARCRLCSPGPFLSLRLAFVHKIGKEKTRKAKAARRAGAAARVHRGLDGKRRVFGPAADHERPFLPQREDNCTDGGALRRGIALCSTVWRKRWPYEGRFQEGRASASSSAGHSIDFIGYAKGMGFVCSWRQPGTGTCNG